jgi:hypothetical protein
LNLKVRRIRTLNDRNGIGLQDTVAVWNLPDQPQRVVTCHDIGAGGGIGCRLGVAICHNDGVSSLKKYLTTLSVGRLAVNHKRHIGSTDSLGGVGGISPVRVVMERAKRIDVATAVNCRYVAPEMISPGCHAVAFRSTASASNPKADRPVSRNDFGSFSATEPPAEPWRGNPFR